MSRLIWIYAVYKSLLLSPVAVTELIQLNFKVLKALSGKSIFSPVVIVVVIVSFIFLFPLFLHEALF